MSRKRRISNYIGLGVLGAILGVVLVKGGMVWYQQHTRKQTVESQLNEVANAFATRDNETVMKWASGEYKDPWGNDPVILSNTEDRIQFFSKGPDGQPNTEDDIKSRLFTREPLDLPETLLKPMPAKEPKESIPDRLKREAKEKIEKMKKDGDEVEGKGWRFNFSWGSKKEKD